MMPAAIDGLEVCRTMKSMPDLASVKIVFLTACSQQLRDIEAGNRTGADAYLIKPFSPLELIDTLQRLSAPA